MVQFPYQSGRGDTQPPEKVRQVVETLSYNQVGVYILKDFQGKALRIGHSKDLRHRIVDYFHYGATGWPEQVDSVEIILANSLASAKSLEKQLINQHRPPHNNYHNPNQTRIDPVKAAITQARRTQILDAAAQVFAEKGFYRTTVRDVAKAAGVADGTIYNYFKNKDDLLVAMVARIGDVAEFADSARHLDENITPQQILTFVMQSRFETLERNKAQLLALLPQALSNPELGSHFFESLAAPTLELFEQVWQAQMERGKIRQTDPRILVRLLFGSFFGLVFLDILGDLVVANEKEKVVEVMLDLLLNGLLPRQDETGNAG